jgi:transketolase
MAEIIKHQDTRREFIDALIDLAQRDSKIVLIVPDVGFNYIENFQRLFPDRFFNLGVTEQSAMTIAAGLALSGFKPYIYSMINFVVFRPYEMVRNAVCLHNANVKIIGVKGSEGYKFLGFSHNLIKENEEIDSLKNMPNLKLFIANSSEDAKNIILETYKTEGPAYIRL